MISGLLQQLNNLHFTGVHVLIICAEVIGGLPPTLHFPLLTPETGF